MDQPQYSRRIKDWPEDERPRERLQQHGENSLSDAQLLAIVLRTGDHASGATAIDLARRILTTFHEDLEAVSSASINELCQVQGIGPAKACEIKAAFELGRRRLARQGGGLVQFRSSRDVAQYLCRCSRG